MNFDQTVELISALSLPSMIGGFVYVGMKLQVLDGLKHDMDVVKFNLKAVCDTLVRKGDLDPGVLKNYSPLQLTEKGQAFIRKVGFDGVLSKSRQAFFAVIDREEPKTKYDVETSAIKSIYGLGSEAFMNPVKIYLYEHPEAGRTYAATLGVYVRDAYLAAHPEIAE